MMYLKNLVIIADSLFYNDSPSYKVIQSKQKELLSLLGASLDIKKIDYELINKYIETLKYNNNRPATINSKLAYLSKILNYAYQNGLIENKPYIPIQKIKASKDKFVDLKTLLLMLRYCKKKHLTELRKILLIGFYTGLRISNILSLDPDDIDNDYLRVWKNKTDNPYSIPIKRRLSHIFNNFKPFILNYQQVYYQFTQMKKELNLDAEITIHSLRHSFCSRLVQKGVNIAIIQKLANHTNIKTTMRYTHIQNKQLEEAINML